MLLFPQSIFREIENPSANQRRGKLKDWGLNWVKVGDEWLTSSGEFAYNRIDQWSKKEEAAEKAAETNGFGLLLCDV